MSEFEQPPTGGVSRRTVTKAMAWAVPVIAIAAPVPAFAGASQGTLTFNGNGCKLPGSSNATFKGNVYKFVAANTTKSTTFTIIINEVTLNGTPIGNSTSAVSGVADTGVTVINLTGCTVLGNKITVPANTTLSNLALLTANAGNSMNGGLVVYFQISTDGGSTYGPIQSTAGVGGSGTVPPINGNSCPKSIFSRDEKACIAKTVPPAAWAAGVTYAVGDVVSLNGTLIVCSVAGTSAAPAPAQPVGNGTTFDGGGVGWQLF